MKRKDITGMRVLDAQEGIPKIEFTISQDGRYVFQGLLKVSVTAADSIINSKFYPMRANLD